MSEALTVNGVSLGSLAYMVTDVSGLMSPAVRRGRNTEVPRRHGRLFRPAKRYDAAEIVLPLWIVGAAADGTIPAGSSAEREFFKRRDELLAIFGAATVVLEFTRPDGSVRRAVCEVVEIADFTRRYAEPVARMSVALTVPGAFWTDTVDVSQALSGTTGSALAWSTFTAATAPMDELTITVGPCTNFQLQQASTGILVAYDGIVAAGRKLVINCANWSLNGTVDAGGNWTPTYSGLRHSGAARWFELTPTADGTAPVTTLTHTAGGSASVTLLGRRKYLTA